MSWMYKCREETRRNVLFVNIADLYVALLRITKNIKIISHAHGSTQNGIRSGI